MDPDLVWALAGLVTALTSGFVKVLYELRQVKHLVNSQLEHVMARLDVALERNVHLESEATERTQDG